MALDDGQQAEPQPESISTEAARQPISAVVISYNRIDLIETCLRALSFADELIVVDKSSTDGTAELAASLADRVLSVPWSPTVEESRAYAVAQCRHDWILCLDDDECLSVEAARYIEEELRSPRAEIYMLPQRHYILGRHDEAAYYWPEHQPRLFRRNSVSFRNTVHSGTVIGDRTVYFVPSETGVCIHHLSHKSVAQWIEKTNRYTSRPERSLADDGAADLAAFSHARIDLYLGMTKTEDRAGYPAAVAVLRAIYDMVDRLKSWELEAGIEGDAAFQAICRSLQQEYGRALPPLRGSATTLTSPRVEEGKPGSGGDDGKPEPASAARLTGVIDALRESLRHVRALSEQAQRRADETIAHQHLSLSEEQARSERLTAEGNARLQTATATLAAAERSGAAALAAAKQTAAAALAEARVAAEEARAETVSAKQEHAASRAVLSSQIEALSSRAETAEDLASRQAERAQAAEDRLAELLGSDFWIATARLRKAAASFRRAIGLASPPRGSRPR